MSFVSALIFSILSLLPTAVFAQEANPTPVPEYVEDPIDNHPVIKCNFSNVEAEPNLTTVIIDPEWSQIVAVSREGKLMPPLTGLRLQIEMKETTPASYIWTMFTKDGQPYIQIQELATDPPRYSILGRRPGTYECYRQSSMNIEYYKRF